MSREKPILFNTDMVRAILEGRKTVTRRVVMFKGGRNPSWTGYTPDGPVLYGSNNIPAAKAPYRIGDILYVREAFSPKYFSKEIADFYNNGNRNAYRADFHSKKFDDVVPEPKWHPSIHMPKEAARIFLRVMDVKVERLQTEFFKQGSAIFELHAEGIDIGETCRECISTYGRPCCNDEESEDGTECGMLDDVRDDFARLWDSTIKPADLRFFGWAANPWVWVIDFVRSKKQENSNAT